MTFFTGVNLAVIFKRSVQKSDIHTFDMNRMLSMSKILFFLLNINDFLSYRYAINTHNTFKQGASEGGGGGAANHPNGVKNMLNHSIASSDVRLAAPEVKVCSEPCLSKNRFG